MDGEAGRKVLCLKCRGAGIVTTTSRFGWSVCQRCGGDGEVPESRVQPEQRRRRMT